MPLLQGCEIFDSLRKTDAAQTSSEAVTANSVTDLSAFQGTVYKFTTTTCVSCHATATPPFHSAPDVNTAYRAVLAYVDFDNPAKSVIASQAGNGHCGTGACMGGTAAMTDAIERWKALRAGAANPPVLEGFSRNPVVATRGMAVAPVNLTFKGTPTLFSIAPALPAGLTFNTATGAITGTPTELAPRAPYTIKASNTSGSSSLQLDLQVNDVPPSALSFSGSPIVATRGTTITVSMPSTMGGAPVSYSVTPALPAGLSLDPITGFISGTPTLVSPRADYVVTAINTGGSTTANVTIQVNEIAPSMLSYARNPLVATRGTTIAPDAPSSQGGPVTVYAAVPALPAGLVLNAMTGVVSGTPTAISPITPYTITAMNSGGTASATLNIQVNDIAPSALAYARNPLVATIGNLIAPDTATFSGGPVTSFSVSPSLPAGLSLNAASGTISGTPTAITAQAAYTVTATNSGGSTTAALAIQVNDAAPSNLSYAPASIAAVRGTAITPSRPTVSGGAVTSWSVSPALPAGIVLDSATGVISGVPTVTSANASYVVTARNSGGSATAAVSIAVSLPPPSNLTYAPNPLVATQGTPIAALSPTLGAGTTASSYAVVPALPAGLALNATTGVISGTPTALSGLQAYVITASGSGGSTAFTLNIQVNAVPPSNLAFSRNPVIAVRGTAIAPITLTAGGGAVVSYSVTPALPAGITLDPASGTIAGTPTATSAQASYTVRATNTGGSATAAITLTVNEPAPAGLAYATNPILAIRGAAITPDLPSSTGGAIASYSVSPPLPAGLTLNAATGVISGVPTAVSAQATYTVTGTNATGSTTAALRIQVSDLPPTFLTYAVNPLVATLGRATTPSSPSNMGGQITSYAIAPSLPAGLSLNSSTGVISGTPTALATAATYTVTGTNSGGSATATLSISVIDVAPIALSYARPNVTYVSAVAITPNVPSSAGGAVTSWTVAPALPAGLSLNAATGIISGTAAAASATSSYVVTARNSGGATTATVIISVVTPNPANPNATWTYINTNILPNCTSCHNATAPSNVIDFTSHAGVLRAVVPREPLNSMFYTYVAPGSVTQMPLGGTPLSQTQLQAIFDWIYIGAPGPTPNPSPSPSPTASPSPNPSPSPDPTEMNRTIPGYGSISVPTTHAVVGRILKVLGPAGVTMASTNFAASLSSVATSLPTVASPLTATGYDQIPLLVFSACADANPAFYTVNTGLTASANSTALINAGVAMVNAHVAGEAATGTALNAQVVQIFTQLVNDNVAAGSSARVAFNSVCMAANTFGVEMTGF
jgi:uncharacterized repeat protein (TIGR01451 family)